MFPTARQRSPRFGASCVEGDGCSPQQAAGPHMRELNELLREVNPEDPGGFSQTSFTLENGLSQMRRCFVDVTVARYEDALFAGES